MKLYLNVHNNYYFAAVFCGISLLINCSSNNTKISRDSIGKQTVSKQNVVNVNSNIGKDSVELTELVKKLYKWHQTVVMKHDGFKPLKQNSTDTLYSGIDLSETEKAIDELKETGLFTADFLNDYRKIALRMDKELKDGSSLWPEGEVSTFGDDSDMWCNCQDFPVDKYWEIIKLNGLNIKGNVANFKWTWGGDFYYETKATKEKGIWKISYLQGFDMNAYSWEWWKKNKKS